jgi:flavin-dependent dehydrogenase
VNQVEDFDVAVVGASLAGCTAATFLGRRGLKVVVLERASNPETYKTPCTHFIQPSATPTLERLGVARDVEAKGGVRNSIDVHTRFGWMLSPIEEYGYSIRRSSLDPIMRKAASSTAGVEVRMGHPVKELLRDGARITGVVAEEKGGARHEIRARLVVAADGRYSKLGEMAGIPSQRQENNRFCYASYYRVTLPDPTRGLLWLKDPDAAWCFPNDEGLIVAAVMPHKDRLAAFKSNLQENYLKEFDGLPRAPDLRKAERVGDLFGMLELPGHIRPASGPGIAFVGDAALTSDPVMGVGCGWALQSAEWLAEDVGDALVAKGDLEGPLATYRRHHDERLRRHSETVADISKAATFSPIERIIFSAAPRDESVRKAIALMNARIRHPDDVMGPGLLVRALWANLTKRVPPEASPS